MKLRRSLRFGRWLRRNLGSTLLVALTAVAAFGAFYRFPYVLLRPGGADSVGARMVLTGTTDHPTKGEIYWATVGIVVEPRLLDMIDARLDSRIDAVRRSTFLGRVSQKDSVRLGAMEMDDSKQAARVVAGRWMGIRATGGGVRISHVERDTPAFGLITEGDIISHADGRALCLIGDLRTAITAHTPGENVTLTVRRSTGKTEDITIETDGNRLGKAFIGVIGGAIADSPCRTSFDVNIDTARIGGPSAGLAMTLEVLDRLTPGELTGGKKVAATGTIEADGRVGMVGGVKQKTHAVRAAGATLFLVPSEEAKLARRYAGPMQVVGVKTLDEAVAALRKFGGDPIPASRARTVL